MGRLFRGLPGYVGLVVVPVVLAVAFGAARWYRVSSEIALGPTDRSARTISRLLLREMGQRQRVLAAEAPVVEMSTPYPAPVQRALEGDTVSGLASSDVSLEMTVVLADSAGVRMIRAPFRPQVLEVAPDVTGLSIAVYLRDRRAATTEPAIGPETLPEGTLEALGRSPDGLPWNTNGRQGTLLPVQPSTGGPPPVVLLAGHSDVPPTGGRLLTLLPVLTIVLALSLLAAGIAARSQLTAPDRPPLAQATLVALIPVVAGAVVLLALDRTNVADASGTRGRELASALSLVRQLNVPAVPSLVSEVTGFRTAGIAPDGSVSTASEDPVLRTALAGLRLPPPNWMASGSLPATEGRVLYRLMRLRSGGGLLVMAPDGTASLRAFRASLLRAAVVTILLAAVHLVAVVARPATSEERSAPSSTEDTTE